MASSIRDDMRADLVRSEKAVRAIAAALRSVGFTPRSGDAQRGSAAEAVREAWRVAIRLGNNICVQESDRENANDGDVGWINGTAECAKRIRDYAEPAAEQLVEMLNEAGARNAVAAFSAPSPREAAQEPGSVCIPRDELERTIRTLRYASHPAPSPHADALAKYLTAPLRPVTDEMVRQVVDAYVFGGEDSFGCVRAVLESFLSRPAGEDA